MSAHQHAQCLRAFNRRRRGRVSRNHEEMGSQLAVFEAISQIGPLVVRAYPKQK